MVKTLGPNTEEGLKELLTANSEDYMKLMFTAEYFEMLGMKEEAKKFREKALVELGHAKAIFTTLVKAKGVQALVADMAKEEAEQHVSEYNKVAMTAKAEGSPEVETMLCSFADQEKEIAETIKAGAKAL